MSENKPNSNEKPKGDVPELLQAKGLATFLTEKAQTISPLLILTHDYPDPDALGSAFALYQIFDKVFDLPAKIAYQGQIGRRENKAMIRLLNIPAKKFRPSDLKKYKHVALVDTQPAFDNNPFPKNRSAALVIDQHAFVKKPDSQFTAINKNAGATSVIMAQTAFRLGLKMTPGLATALVYGILSDTMNLFRSDRQEDVQTYLKLLPLCNIKALSKIQNPVRSKDTYVTLGKGIQNAQVYKRVMISRLGELRSPDLLSQVSDFLIGYKNMTCCLCIGRFHGKLYASLRLKNSAHNAGTLLRGVFEDPANAGGHRTIGGGSVPLNPNATPEEIQAFEDGMIQRLFKLLRIKGEVSLTKPFKWDEI